MRVVGGRHRGRALAGPKDRAVRPTSDRAREAIFNLLEQGRVAAETGFALKGCAVLDVFCGTGAFAVEALSRGAARATLIDNSDASLDVARRNLEAIDVGNAARLVRADATNPPPAPATHDLVFLDPPYGSDLSAAALGGLAEADWIAEGALIVLERSSKADPLALPDGFETIDSRTYGAARMLFLKYLSN